MSRGAEACQALIVQPLACSHGVLAHGRVCKPFARECGLIRHKRWPTAPCIRTDRWPTSARVGKPEGCCSQATKNRGRTSKSIARMYFDLLRPAPIPPGGPRPPTPYPCRFAARTPRRTLSADAPASEPLLPTYLSKARPPLSPSPSCPRLRGHSASGLQGKVQTLPSALNRAGAGKKGAWHGSS
jgi:hypothetical protein